MKIELYSPLSIHEIGKRANQEDFLWPDLLEETTADMSMERWQVKRYV